MSQSGLKHAATEPGQIAGKRERQPRTAAGRAAALRRAPSDSDCSGETASLSADSGDRAPRLPPPTTRQAKSRSSRRRGSEWEVLEGLKDGQRFDKRPEVFNGYLHKKRKWPLKGWHKRFFVVDGGILVYARSPTDVARGRLHGSVDVGLSVISAKQRRRRIDIDADEFIYHLRAKTPDVFRTWLNVLKTHRLYRQHLLTFGAREPVPAIHAPLEDILPTDSSSRTTLSSIESFSSMSSGCDETYSLLPCHHSLYDPRNSQIITTSMAYDKIDCYSQNSINSPQLYETLLDVRSNGSPISHVLECAYKEEKMPHIESESFDSINDKLEHRKYKKNMKCFKSTQKNKETEKDVGMKQQPLSAYFCFMRKKHHQSVQHGPSLLKGSRKSTNVVRYRNSKEEPTLIGPLSNCLLINKHKFGAPNQNVKNPKTRPMNTYVSCNLVRFDDNINNVICESPPKSIKIQLDTDRIIEKLVSDKTKNLMKGIPSANIDMACINKIVKNIFEVKTNISHLQPEIKSTIDDFIEDVLLESNDVIRTRPKRTTSVDCPSKTYFTKDQNLSFIGNTCVDRAVQCESNISSLEFGIKRIIQSMKGIYDTSCDADLIKPLQEKSNSKYNSFDREKRIQNLERILRSTMYDSDSLITLTNHEDIEITKVLINSLDIKSAHNVNLTQKIDNADMEEVPKLQETINEFIRETNISTDVATDFLNAYLNVLTKNCNNNHNTESSSSDSNDHDTLTPKTNSGNAPIKSSKSVATITNLPPTSPKTVSDHTMKPNPSLVHEGTSDANNYFKDFFDKFTNIFNTNVSIGNYGIIDNTAIKFTPINIAGKKSHRDTLTIDLSKYNLENVLMKDDPADRDSVSVAIKLRRKVAYDGCDMYSNNSQDTITAKTHLDDNSNITLNRSNISMTSYEEVNDVDCNHTENDRSRSLCDICEETLEYTQEHSFFDLLNQFNNCSMNRVMNNDYNQTCFIVSSFKKTSKQLLTHTKSSRDKPSQILSSESSSESQSRNRISVFDKTPPKTIDERFILLLLENLALLSKDLPTINKDIRNLYVKLKKKHEKYVKLHKPGLSLLGKIYSSEYSSSSRVISSETDDSFIKNKYVQTPTFKIPIVAFDKTTTTIQLPMRHKRLQTEVIPNYMQYAMKIYTPSKIDSTNSSSQTSPFKSSEENNEEKRTFTPTWAQLNLKHINKNDPNSKCDHDYTDSSPLKCCKKCCLGCSKYNIFPVFAFEDKWNLPKLLNDKDVVTVYRCESEQSFFSGYVSPTSSQVRNPGYTPGTPAGRLAAWSLEAGGPLDVATRELGQAQSSIQQLQRLIDTLELQQQVHHDTDVSLDGASPNVKKDRRKFGLRKKKSNSKCASVELAPPQLIDGSASHMALSTLTAPPSPGGGATSVPSSAASLPIACAATRPQSLPGAESLAGPPGPASLTSLTPDQQLREDFTILAKDLVKSLKSVVATLVIERGRLRAAIDATETGPPNSSAMLTALRNNLNTALHQNSELRNRLSRIHDASDMAEISSVGPNSDAVSRQFQQSLSYSSSCASEFFDAEEHDIDLNPDLVTADQGGVIELDGDSSSEAGSLSSEEGSASSDNSDGALLSAEPRTALGQNGVDNEGWVRRKCLPCPRPTPGGPSLWNLLYKNIGKDLSQISMPVTINEPLNMLQRLCEELEYSEILDAAAECKNSIERMSLIAAFAVSAYAASAHRAASKPFNPLLAETYECIRDDRGFRFISEQVSHHPPISACHAESPRWCFWQEARIKTKFWGKSMEFQPAGRVHVKLHSTGDHYSWNKVTTCVHNLFGGQRWVDQYGDMHIMCHGTDITCKLNFIKASSWSTSRHEVRGAINAGGTRVRLAGRWSEALYAGDPPAAKCLWRPGAMPPDHELYYGFTRFAMELNELEPGMSDILPHTDTRLRPDQRALEEGDVEAAEKYKHQLEQAQRERRRDSPEYMPQWFRLPNGSRNRNAGPRVPSRRLSLPLLAVGNICEAIPNEWLVLLRTMDSGDEMWVFNGEYWKEREAGFVHSRAPSIW